MFTTFLILSLIAWSLSPQSLILVHESDLSPVQLRGETTLQFRKIVGLMPTGTPPRVGAVATLCLPALLSRKKLQISFLRLRE